MKTRDIKELLEKEENFELEFKRKVSTPVKIAKTIISFANTRGGILVFGVDDDHTIVGVDNEKEEIEMILTAANFYCEPSIEPYIEIIPHKGKDIIVVTIEESKQKPHHLNTYDKKENHGTGVYIRVKDKTVEASKEVVKILEAENPFGPPLRVSIGDNEKYLLDYLEKVERITVKEYAKLVNVSYRRASRSLTQLVRAGILRIHTNEKEDYYTKSP